MCFSRGARSRRLLDYGGTRIRGWLDQGVLDQGVLDLLGCC